ncbi:MAG: hypothetical protein ACTHJ7_02800 [Candidatus Nitrosocosmicus sp.]
MDLDSKADLKECQIKEKRFLNIIDETLLKVVSFKIHIALDCYRPKDKRILI